MLFIIFIIDYIIIINNNLPDYVKKSMLYNKSIYLGKDIWNYIIDTLVWNYTGNCDENVLNFLGSNVPFGQLYKHASNGTRLQKSELYPWDKQFVNDSNPSFVDGLL